MEQLTPDWRGAVALPKAMEAKAGTPESGVHEA